MHGQIDSAALGRDRATGGRDRGDGRLLWLGLLLVCLSAAAMTVAFVAFPLLASAFVVATAGSFGAIARARVGRRRERRTGRDRRLDVRPHGRDRRSGLDRRSLAGAR